MFILIVSCNDREQNKSTEVFEEKLADNNREAITKTEPIDSLHFITDCDTIPLDLLEFTRKRNSLLTFRKQTYLYCSPSTESRIIDSIPFNQEIVSWETIVRSYKPKEINRDGKLVTIHSPKETWYETNINERKVYFNDKELALERLRNHVLFGEIPDTYGYKILSYNPENRNEILDSLELNRNHGYEIESLVYNGLEPCKGVIRYRDFRQSCPGTSSTTFIALDHKGRFNKLLSSYNGTESSSTIYFPLKFESGKTLLVADGNVNQIFDYHSGELNTFSYSEEIDIPINQLIVETKIEYAGDIEGLSGEEIEIIKSETVYYQWNGSELNKIKTTSSE